MVVVDLKVRQHLWASGGWEDSAPELATSDLVLVFGSRALLDEGHVLEKVRRASAGAFIFGCSTAGEIHATSVLDDSVSVTGIRFDSTRLSHAAVSIRDVENSYQAGSKLAEGLPEAGLSHVFVLSDGLLVNGSELVHGLVDHLPKDVAVTGGLAGDGGSFERTLVVYDGEAHSGHVAVVGLYGPDLRVGYGSLGGWDSFGPERLITRSEGNVLFELDGKSALGLYKTYLGDQAAGLPATGLLFPLSLRTHEDDVPVVRTILGIDEATGSLTFAGDVPMGSYARLMKANFDRLVDGAHGAALTSRSGNGESAPDIAILVSCVGRKMILKQRTEEEVEAVSDVLGLGVAMTGFYSYGEIAPFMPTASCDLHNQTMTITTFSERPASR